MIKSNTDILIERLEKYAKSKDLKFVYAQERGPNGRLVLYFKTADRSRSYSHALSHEDIDNVIDIKLIVKRVKECVEEKLCLL